MSEISNEMFDKMCDSIESRFNKLEKLRKENPGKLIPWDKKDAIPLTSDLVKIWYLDGLPYLQMSDTDPEIVKNLFKQENKN